MAFTELLSSILHISDLIYGVFSKTIEFFATPYHEVMNYVLGLEIFAGAWGVIPTAFLNYVLGPVFGNFSLFDMMFGLGIPVIMAYTLITWVLNILP